MKRTALATVLRCIHTNSERAVELLAQLYDATENGAHETIDVHMKDVKAIVMDLGFDAICGLECAVCKADAAPVFVSHSGLCESCTQTQIGMKHWTPFCTGSAG